MELKKYLDGFKGRNIAVIGDIMLDKYIFGKVDRISPEAPVQIVKVDKEEYVPGGAANAASNVMTLSGNPFLFGILGDDNAKEILMGRLKSMNIDLRGVVVDPSMPTMQKIRVIAHNQHLLRIDYEETGYINSKNHAIIMGSLKTVDGLDAIIISDYAKGTITERLMREIKGYAKKNGIPVIVDPKPKHKRYYRDVDLITPNKKEAGEMAGLKLDTERDIEAAGKELTKELNCDVIITRGDEGMSVFRKGLRPVHFGTAAKEVYDVSGAGDTVIASLALSLSSGAELDEAVVIANHAGGIKVGKLGTSPVHKKELQEDLAEEHGKSDLPR